MGEWKNNQMHGHGHLKAVNGAEYEGHWQDGRFHDEGELRLPDGTSYVGRWRHGLEHGLGTVTFPDGKTYDGQWVKGEVEGRGTLTYGDGRKQYIGQFRSAKPHGIGSMVYADGFSYEGQWQYGVPAGKGQWGTSKEGGKVRELTPVSSVRPSPREDFTKGFAEGSEMSEPSKQELHLETISLADSKFDDLDDQLSRDAAVPATPLGTRRPAAARPGLPERSNPVGQKPSAVTLGITQQVLDPFARSGPRGKSKVAAKRPPWEC